MGVLQGKIAVITRGNRGIRLATAKRVASKGAFVLITGRRQDELDKAVKQIGKNVVAMKSDVSKLGDIDRLYKEAQKKGNRGKLELVKRQLPRRQVL